MSAHRARQGGGAVPGELRVRPRWVRRSTAKVPLTIDGRAASVTDPSCWSGYEAAVTSGAGGGLGFVLDGDGVVCVDLDGCLVGGRLASWAEAIIDRCADTWVEVSPSGTGLHVWGFGQVERGRRLRGGGRAVEVYGSGRYIAVTGETFRGAPTRLGHLDGLLEELVACP